MFSSKTDFIFLSLPLRISSFTLPQIHSYIESNFSNSNLCVDFVFGNGSFSYNYLTCFQIRWGW
ncbi:hypothetical protein AAZX31_13G075800 [Glycine max]